MFKSTLHLRILLIVIGVVKNVSWYSYGLPDCYKREMPKSRPGEFAGLVVFLVVSSKI